ncbi:MAG: efflux RND transporter permease subunit [Phycisphaerales bacterium]|nr:MAG: efflux RND transporter permease subunit [Phycisphaerales bacterium]
MIDRLVKTFLTAPVLAVLLAAVLAGWGWQSFEQNPKDAIPDIAENQAIVFTEWMGRSPKDMDEQVTYPLTVALQGVPGVREIRATSGFGWSIVYVVFHDNIGFYWARNRVLERLNVAQGSLPDDVTPRLGPDATALGQVFWYTVENGWYSPLRPGLRFSEDGLLTESSRLALPQDDPLLQMTLDRAQPYTCPLTGTALAFSRFSLDELRSIQDFDVKLALESVEGVSEAASVGGYVRQYQIDVDPAALRAFDVPLAALVSAVKSSNVDVGAKVIEQDGMEVLVRGVGFLGGGDRGIGSRHLRERAAIADIENIVVKAIDGAPIYIRQLADVTTGPDFRRGALDKMGAEAVGGCVVMRFGENPLTVIERVKEKIAKIETGLPPGVHIQAFYDRSTLIRDTMTTLGTALWQELLITVIAVVLFLLHFRSSLVIAVTLPLAVLFAFICMQALDVGSNIMSLAGIAIAIGTMVDMGIVMTENIYQYLTAYRSQFTYVMENSKGRKTVAVDAAKRTEHIQQAAAEVGRAILTAVSTTVISFLPVFFLEGQSAKLFTPLAWTKTFCLVGAVIMALVIVPPLASVLLRERRVSRRRTAAFAVSTALLAGGVWMVTCGPSASVSHVGQALRDYLHLQTPFDAILIGAIAFVLTWVVTRERIRVIDDNPIGRLIHRGYEPALRWILGHKVLFMCLPTLIVLWGISIWLGSSRILGVLVAPLRWIGVAIDQWSVAWWIHLFIGLAVGLVILPLIIDSIRVIRGRSRTTHWTHWLGRGGYVAFALATALSLHSVGLAQSRSSAVAAVVGLPLTDPTTDVPVDLDDFVLLAAAMEDGSGIGQEFMPPLDEGDFLYMPSVLPAGSINTVMNVMQKQDIQFAQIDEVEMVVGKLGRIESPLDPAPVGMLETVIALKPRDQWPLIEDPEHPGRQRRRTMREIWERIQQAGRFPGVLPSVELQPIRTRVEMLSTGFSAKIGLKVYGDNLATCEELAVAIEQILRHNLPEARSVSAIRVSGKPYLEFHIDREAIARYGVNIRDVQNVIEVAIGGKNLTTTYEGLDRYPVRIRYQRELRDDLPDLERILVSTPSGAQIPITQVADLQSVVGPMSVRREGASYVSYVTMTNAGVDETTLVARGQAVLDRAIIDGTLDLPQGYRFKWAGSYERNVQAKKRLSLLVPLVLLINFVLIYLQFKRLSLAFVIFLAIPVAFAGGFILLQWWPGIQNWLYLVGLLDRGFEGEAMYLTVAVWVGFIALFGIAVDDGIVMGTYLDQTFRKNRVTRYEDIAERVVEAGLRRIRPCLMTTFTTLAALAVVLLSTGRGADVMVPMAIPVFGGMTVALIAIFVVPACYCGIKQIKWRLGLPDPDFAADFESE